MFVRRYYHPTRHLLRSLAEPLEANDLTIIPTPHPPISTGNEETKALNTAPRHPTKSKATGKSKCGSPKKMKSDKPKNIKSDSKIDSPKKKKSDSKTVSQKGSSDKILVVESARNEDNKASGSSVNDANSNNDQLDTTDKETCNVTVNSTEKVQHQISIVPESVVGGQSMTILPENMITISVGETTSEAIPAADPTIQIVQQEAAQQSIQIIQTDRPNSSTPGPVTIDNSNIIQIVQNPAGQTSSHSIEIVPANDDVNAIEIVPSNQIQIVSGDSTQIQVVSSENSIQVCETFYSSPN